MSIRYLAIVLSLILLLPIGLSFADREYPLRPNNEVLAGRYIVVVADDQSPEDVARDHGIEPEIVFKSALKGFAGPIKPDKARNVRDDSRVLSVENDRRVKLLAQILPTGIDRIDNDLNALAKIDQIDERVDVDIAILDTGIDFDHPDLNVYKRVDCASFFGCIENSGNDLNGHGSHVAGITGAIDNDFGVVGVAPGARLWSIQVLDNTGSGYISWIVAGIDYVHAHASEIEVDNMSFGCECSSPSLDSAISNTASAGVVQVAAAGNAGKDARKFSPANHPDVITVSAVADFDGIGGGLASPTCRADVDDTFADFSNFGSTVEIAAPGVCILSTWRNGGYNTISGTSMSSPHVAGAAALYIAKNGRDLNNDGLVNKDD